MSLTELIIGGFLGTIVMTMMILYGSKMNLMPSGWNMLTDGLGGMMNNMMGVSPNMAYMVHFLIGTVVHPLTYNYIWVDALGVDLGSYINEIVYALIFAVMMIGMLPMLKAPDGWTSKIAMGIIMAHIVYAIVLALIAG